ncbi:carbon-nitrogen hydrolase [Apiospora aurea]|uniref:Carbon-nitrogen hydrolase n=1 Tax=Apiospora aurea TaxID=335848 RepID=A0ABR1Q902_9PEZI
MGVPPKGTIRLATASPATQGTTRETLSQLQKIAARAVANQADLLLLPEAYLGGYPRGSDFGCRVGARTDEGRDEFLRYFQAAVDLGDTVGNGAGAGDAWVRRQLPGNQAEAADDVVAAAAAAAARDPKATAGQNQRGDGTREELERIARDTGVFIVVGLVEKAGGSLYCSVVYVSPKQGMIGKRRKVQPTGTERLIWAQGSPATLKAVTTTIRGVRINLAAAICWENYMPLLRQSLYQQNINLYLAPTADGRDTWLGLVRTIALEGRCFVVSSNMCVHSSSGTQQQQQSGSVSVVASPHDREALSWVTSPPYAHHGSTTRRRNSCLTEEGFEIALPRATSTTSSSSSPPRARKERRRSIFDDDGNEIVLPCDGKEKAASAAADVVVEEDEGVDVSAVDDAQKQKQQQVGAGAATTTRKSTTAISTGKFLSRGGSSIVSPMGDVIAGPQWEDDQGIIYADVDFEDCIRGRLDLDAAGSYSRNDSFKFSVEGLDLDPLPY